MQSLMRDQTSTPAPGKPAKSRAALTREERLKAALKANMARRKAQAKAKAPAPAGGADSKDG
jgi:hypothetical protein